MPDLILCKICGKRRARRPCPAVHGDICALCCGTERENSLTCPLQCVFLQEGHRHEKPVAIADDQLALPELRITEQFVQSQEELLLFCMYSLVEAALRTPGAVDTDVVAALQSLIQTHRTLESGLVYESRSENSLAAGIQRQFSASLADYQKVKQERESLAPVRNSDILAILVFICRIGQQNLNGKPRGRMFLDLMRRMTPNTRVEERAPSIIL
jgi:hypothetical protein